MRRYAILVTLTLTFALAAFAQDYTVMNVGGLAPTIDADLSDWVYVREAAEFDGFTEHNGGIWDGDDDASGLFWLTWSSDGLYLAVDVIDDSHLNTNVGNAIWNGDSCQVVVEPTGDRPAGGAGGVIYEYNFGLGGGNSDSPQFSRAIQHAQAPNQISVEYAFQRIEAEKRTVYELFFPEADIAPADLEPDSEIGFSLIVNDGDDGGGQDGQKGWLGWGEGAIVFGKDAGQTKLIVLSSETLAVDPAGKLTSSWGSLKAGR